MYACTGPAGWLHRPCGGSHKPRRERAAARGRFSVNPPLSAPPGQKVGEDEFFAATGELLAPGALYSSDDEEEPARLASTSGRTERDAQRRSWSVERARVALAELSGRHWADGDYHLFQIRGANYLADRVKARARARAPLC